MPKILQLDRHVADLIAAGEVVERPASAVKELVENAVDAGATQVTVEIQNGGMSYIRVTDNGCGMEPKDAETAFLRHATSKLRTKEDLAAIGTLGFRGEALAAIASVSKIDMMTKMAGHEGISLHLEAGVITERTPAGCPEGTTIVVRELFYNTPARLKFMKRDSVESSQVAGTLQKQALAHPNVAFRLIKDGETVLQTAGNGDLHGAVYQIFGRQLAVDMVQVKSRWENMSLFGFVTKPTATRGNRNYQQFFVNGRPVKSPMMASALEQAYENQMMTGRFPSGVLCLELPPQAVDVNVHPAKTEVKFAAERNVFDCIRFGVLSALNKEPGKPQMQLEKSAAPRPAAVSQPTAVSQPKPKAVPSPKAEQTFRTMTAQDYRSFVQALEEKPARSVAPQVAKAMQQPRKESGFVTKVPPMPDQKPAVAEVRQEIRIPKPVAEPPKPKTVASAPVPQPAPAPKAEPAPQETEQLAMDMPPAADYRIVGEVLQTYIIVEHNGQVLFIDKHAAHERIRFEQLKQENAPIMAQLLLTPMTVSMTAEETAAVLENRLLLQEFGYEAEDFGQGTLLVRQVPADMNEKQAELLLQELAEDLLQGRRTDPTSLRDAMLHTIACKSSIKAGWHTEQAELEYLVRQVMEREDIKYCPHGRPVCVTLTKQQLEKQFKRT